MLKKLKLISIILLLIISISFMTGCMEENTVNYEVTFHAVWSEETHPDDFPSNPHFSGLIGASHNSNVSFWKSGGLASEGIKNMAETGSKNPLTEEIGLAILNGDALDLLSGGGIGTSPGSTSVTFQVSVNYPYVSLVTMIAPSPDWFVGVDSLNLYDNGEFVDELIVDLYAYDAGTDSGSNYTSPDNPTDPPVPVYKIEGYPFRYDGELISLGYFEFKQLG